MAFRKSHHCAIRLMLALIMLSRAHQVFSARWQAASAEGIAEAQHPGHNRKLLSCSILAAPTYTSRFKSQNGLPFCSTQYANLGTGSEWVAVHPDDRNSVLKANSADLANAWYTNPDNPKTDTTLQCSGEVSTTRSRCWGGNRVYTNTTFASISCCSTQQFCYIKTGGCVL